MIGVVIVAHGTLAQGYLKAIEHVVGQQDGIHAISIDGDADRAAKQTEICAAADQVDAGVGVLIVTDMFGASPSNLALKACQPENRRIIYGANLPMLIKLVKCRHLSLTEATNAAVEAGRKYIDCHQVSTS
ncbi:MAG: PTS fructose transporter subunit IIA [Pseudomonadota bacterium]